MQAKASIYINKYKTSDDGRHPISIKIAFVKERRYYPLGFSMSLDEFERPKKEQKTFMSFAQDQLAKAIQITHRLGPSFSFSMFEKDFLRRATPDSVGGAFDDMIETIEKDRIGSIEFYENAKKSFLAFDSRARLIDITPAWLKKYEKKMLESGRSVTTVGMYMRHLRSVLNSAKDYPRELYPFGKGGYEIPTARNEKKALSREDVELILKYETDPTQKGKAMARDLWGFIFFGNGINVADLCRLRKNDMGEDTIFFVRQKTKRTKREVQPITIIKNDHIRAVIEKYGQKAVGNNPYIFPFLKEKMQPEDEEKAVKNLTRLINKHVTAIANEMGVKGQVTTYTARHSFATILKNKNVPLPMISQLLGHSSIATTERYFAQFGENDIKKAIGDALD